MKEKLVIKKSDEQEKIVKVIEIDAVKIVTSVSNNAGNKIEFFATNIDRLVDDTVVGLELIEGKTITLTKSYIFTKEPIKIIKIVSDITDTLSKKPIKKVIAEKYYYIESNQKYEIKKDKVDLISGNRNFLFSKVIK